LHPAGFSLAASDKRLTKDDSMPATAEIGLNDYAYTLKKQ
jgi:hypothetical protein